MDDNDPAAMRPTETMLGDDGSRSDRAIYEDFTRLNNELVNLQREMVGKNAELQESEQRYRALNAELEDRVLARTAELERARVEAERANRAKSTFLAVMSHEIRTPMNGVLGMIDVLLHAGLTAPQVEMVDLARASALSLLRTLDDILDFSKAEAGKLALESKPMDVAALLGMARAAFEQSAAARGVAVSVFVDPRIPGRVLGDEVRLRQVLDKLVDNAIKFSAGLERPGQVSVRAMLAGRQAEGVGVELVVADNGIGMSEGTRANLFTPFTQADASMSRRYGGTGLGLAVADMLVRLMGGTISVASVAGEGSTFIVRLRLATVAPAGAPAARSGDALAFRHDASARPAPSSREEALRARRLILVAEDNAINRRVIVEQLRLAGFAADIAVDGREALGRWRSGDYALLLTDLQMPEMDGYELAAAIRAEEGAGRRMPIFALTANSLPDDEARCLAVGMDAYLVKPVSLDRMKTILDAALAGAPRPE